MKDFYMKHEQTISPQMNPKFKIYNFLLLFMPFHLIEKHLFMFLTWFHLLFIEECFKKTASNICT